MYYTKFYKYLSEFLTTNEVPFEAFAKMVVKYDDDRNRFLKARHFAVYRSSLRGRHVQLKESLAIPYEVCIISIGGPSSIFVMCVA